jgi:hypothetical protein
MNRRQFLTTTVAATVAGLSSGSAQALLTCTPFMPPGVQQCDAGINSEVANVVAAAVNGQHLTQWCWAASIEAVFRYYGFNISQEEIVRQTWGTIVNLPGQPWQILANLNRPWVDANGRQFVVSGDTYSANPMTAAQDLAHNMPLIIGTQGHAMVLTSLRYGRDYWGNGQVTSAIVRDPWPGRGRRELSPQEWYGTSLLVRIRVTPIS